jgi:hypothetical protein
MSLNGTSRLHIYANLCVYYHIAVPSFQGYNSISLSFMLHVSLATDDAQLTDYVICGHMQQTCSRADLSSVKMFLYLQSALLPQVPSYKPTPDHKQGRVITCASTVTCWIQLISPYLT